MWDSQQKLRSNLEGRFPNSGMDRFERCVANYLDPRWKGVHLSINGNLESTKRDIENKWEEVRVDPTEPRVDDRTLSPTSKLIKNRRLAAGQDLT